MNLKFYFFLKFEATTILTQGGIGVAVPTVALDVNGTIKCATQAQTSNNTAVATTNFVNTAVYNAVSAEAFSRDEWDKGVQQRLDDEINTRQFVDGFKATIESPTFTGTVTIPEGSLSRPGLSFANDGSPDTGFYHTSDGVFSVANNNIATMQFTSSQINVLVNLASPTHGNTVSNNLVATTGFVHNVVSEHIGYEVTNRNDAISNAVIAEGEFRYDQDFAEQQNRINADNILQTNINNKAPLNSPSFTSTPTSTQATDSDNSYRIATTNWIRSAMANIASSAGLTASYGVNGYIKFPSWLGGLVIQWGVSQGIQSDTQSYCGFAMAFPNACLNVVATPKATSSTIDNWALIIDFSKTGCTIGRGWYTGMTPETNSMFFIAIGY
ncbi:hypothetical protein [Methylobacter sp. S3L5C]|uniref:gp53-like domain-containing protein n=1 Tax=Methylobacter sp. S3L5C TaxID=2839024 RepID=UPI001FAB3F42|nr:hypothetical protein [Methylobacter sp. S3L5C]UOA08618.1 hypothetical protein KKZ03_20915 [Methylobacter sp. S3L5C]